MTVWEIIQDSNNYNSILLSDHNDWPTLEKFAGQSLKISWQAIDVYTPEEEIHLSGDFPALTRRVPVFSEKTLMALQPLLADSIEALPLKYGEHFLYAINALRIVDCLDRER